MTTASAVDGRLARGDRTRTAILDAAIRLATEAGLDGLSLGQLAEALGVSKSGLFAHWRSKEDLQLATIDHAVEHWLVHVIHPALAQPRGIRRLWAIHDLRVEFYAAEIFPGGCFFGNAEFEFNARPGPVRDRLAANCARWMALLERLATEAIEVGELPPDLDVRLLAYEIEALGLTAVKHARLLPTPAYDLARRAVLERLRALCPDPTRLEEIP